VTHYFFAAAVTDQYYHEIVRNDNLQKQNLK